MSTQNLKSGEPCDHRGCLNHVSHPCDGCGRVAGQGDVSRIDWEEYDKVALANEEKRKGYRAENYTGEKCKNCDRNRVMKCENGKHICEKCGWDADLNRYDSEYSSLS